MTGAATIPLEDEIGDVMEKAMRGSGLTLESLAGASGVAASRLRDAIDYRPDLSAGELRRIAAALRLNEVGFCALGAGRYPLPEIGRLPFAVWPLRLAHGIGVANAYLVAEWGGSRGLLFDTGPGLAALSALFPGHIRELEAVFLTHVEAEHAGGLAEVMRLFAASTAHLPVGASAPGGTPIGEGQKRSFGELEVTVFSTPGHASAHNCYWVRLGREPGLLVSGDLVFAGSAGGGYFSPQQVRDQLRRILETLPPETVIAPGHGPMTTVGNERWFNPFSF